MHEQFYTVKQLVEMWRLSEVTIRDPFKGEEGELRIAKRTRRR